nr:hypothetical protein [Streptomyces sp. EN16]
MSHADWSAGTANATAFRALGDRWGMAAALGSRTFHAIQRGDLNTLRRDGEQSLALFRELGDQWGQLQASVPLGTLAETVGDYQRAGRLYREGLRMAEDLGFWPQASFQLSGLGRVALLTGNLPRAKEFHERAARLAAGQSESFGEQYAEIGLALGARRAGDLDAAEQHLTRVLDLHHQMGYEPSRPSVILAELGFVAEVRGDAPAALALQLDAPTAAHDTGNPRALALALEGLAGGQSLASHFEHAARLLGAATVAARQSVQAPLRGGERFDVDRITTRVRAALDEARYQAEFERGSTLAPEAHLKTHFSDLGTEGAPTHSGPSPRAIHLRRRPPPQPVNPRKRPAPCPSSPPSRLASSRSSNAGRRPGSWAAPAVSAFASLAAAAACWAASSAAATASRASKMPWPSTRISPSRPRRSRGRRTPRFSPCVQSLRKRAGQAPCNPSSRD